MIRVNRRGQASRSRGRYLRHRSSIIGAHVQYSSGVTRGADADDEGEDYAWRSRTKQVGAGRERRERTCPDHAECASTVQNRCPHDRWAGTIFAHDEVANHTSALNGTTGGHVADAHCWIGLQRAASFLQLVSVVVFSVGYHTKDAIAHPDLGQPSSDSLRVHTAPCTSAIAASRHLLSSVNFIFLISFLRQRQCNPEHLVAFLDE
ncbi:hypothetical protein FGB62_130g131 [Gracilaria domingensis]|nr:hypothetical protein FGB62_130g131 [Gracilaria domingensis]